MRTRLAAFTCALTILAWAGEPAAVPKKGYDPFSGWATAAALRTRGLELGYNLDHDEALAAFNEAIAADPHDPAPYRLKAAATWIALLFEQGVITVDDYLGQARANLPRSSPTAALDTAFHDSLRHALTLSEQRLAEHPTDADAHYQIGAAYGFLASYTSTVDGRVLGSLGAARRAYREHERVLALDPRRKDAGLIVGLYRYAVAALPGPLRLMAHLAGFGGGRERGLRMVEEAASYPSDVQSNALFTLILLYNREARYDDALRVIGELQRRYPRNRLLWLEAGNTALRAGRLAEAKASLEEGLARLSRDGRPRASGEEARWRYAHGATLVALKDVTAAEPELRAALAGATRDWVRGRAHKELGKLADLSGNRSRARDEYRLADRLCRQDHDSECSDEVKRSWK
jgi:tetratricopeptide (TPR) repeat protein